MTELANRLSGMDFSPLFISLKTGIAATILAFFAGIYTAWLTMREKRGLRAVTDGILTLPMILPPTASGFILLLVFSTRRPVGGFLYDSFGIKAVQTWLGCVIAAFVISFPLMYRNARSAFEQLDINLVYTARTLGMSEHKILWRVVIPSTASGVASGTVLTFARAIGEYGATSMLAGNIAGKTGTISQKIAMVIQDGDYIGAGIWVAIVGVIAFFIILIINIISMGKKYDKW